MSIPLLKREIKSNYNIYQGEVQPNHMRKCEVYI